MAEIPLGDIVQARSDVAGYDRTTDSRTADKMHMPAMEGDRGHRTSAPSGQTPKALAASAAGIGTGSRAPRLAVDDNRYRTYRRICDALVGELKHAPRYLVEDRMSDEGLEIVAEVEALVEELYGADWGEGECLKRVVVAINSQINNTAWTKAHVEFLRDVAAVLRSSYSIDEAVVDECYRLMEEHGLEMFRGTVTDCGAERRYQIVEVKEP